MAYSLFEQVLSIFWPQRDPRPVPVAPIPPPASVAPAEIPTPTKDQCREWRITQYYLASQADHPGTPTVPILDNSGQTIELATAAFFSSLALEGSGIAKDGKLLNVSSKWVPVDPAKYQSVWEYHKKYLSKRDPSYSGLQIVNDHVARALAFYEVPKAQVGTGFGICNKIPLSPYRTLAADIGKGKKSDPTFISSGGVVPVGTKVYILELDGKKLPDGSTHDGWCVVNDTGGGIFGAHFDCFIGNDNNSKTVSIPSTCHIWFEGVDKLPKP